MGKQYNKIEKQRRRKAYLERKKIKAKSKGTAISKPKAKKAPAKKAKADSAA